MPVHENETMLVDPLNTVIGVVASLCTFCVIWGILCASWGRRWQLQDMLLGGSPYELLSAAYETEPVGVLHFEAESNDAHHDHGHEHDHGPRDLIVVHQRWALVTGGARGIGRAFVRTLADQGFNLIVLDCDEAELSATIVQTNKRLERGWRGGVWRRTEVPPTATAIVCNVAANVGEAVRLCEVAVSALPRGALRLLVNNVGTCTSAPSLLSQHSADDVERILRTNSEFHIQLTRALWSHLLLGAAAPQHRSGLLFVSSRAACDASPFDSVCAATKAGLDAFARALRAEAIGLSQRVDVLSVTPGPVRSGHIPRWMGHSRGLAEPDDVARAALLLLETAQSATVTPRVSDAVADALMRSVLPEARRAMSLYSQRSARRMEACAWVAEIHCCLCLQRYSERAGRRELVPCGHLVCGRCALDGRIEGGCPVCKASVADHIKLEAVE